MLILSRKKGESLVIEDCIEVFVVEIRGDRVRLGVLAPRSVVVDRREVRDAKLSALAEAEIASSYQDHGAPVG